MLFKPSRDERATSCSNPGAKRRAKEVLTPLEDLVAQLIEKHPEYHAILEDSDRYQQRDYQPEQARPTHSCI